MEDRSILKIKLNGCQDIRRNHRTMEIRSILKIELNGCQDIWQNHWTMEIRSMLNHSMLETTTTEDLPLAKSF